MGTSVTALRSGHVTEDRAERETRFHLRAKWWGRAAAGPTAGESGEEAPRLAKKQNALYRLLNNYKLTDGQVLWEYVHAESQELE